MRSPVLDIYLSVKKTAPDHVRLGTVTTKNIKKPFGLSVKLDNYLFLYIMTIENHKTVQRSSQLLCELYVFL